MSIRTSAAAVLAAITVAGSSIAVQADEWDVVDIRDPTNSEVNKGALAINGDGFSVQIFRSEDGRVRWILALPKASFDRLPDAGRIAAVRIDENASKDIKIDRSSILNLEQPISMETAVRTILWHGEGASPTRGTLRNMLDGKELDVRFYTTDGHVDTSFDLDGSAPVIAEALGIEAAADPEYLASTRARDEAILNASAVCNGASDLRACLGALSSCMGDTATLTPAKLKSCMTSSGYPYD